MYRLPDKPLTLTAERVAKIETPILEIERKVSARHAEEKAEKKKQEEGQMKKAKEKAGKLGKNDATQKDTVIPKGDKDVLREKVSKIGLLGLVGKERPQGSGLSKLFAEDTSVEQAVAGMAGAKMVAGRGNGGLSTSGAGPGGGGTGYGHIYGAGNLDTGGRGTHGKGRGPKLAERGEKEVSVGLGQGGGDMDGSLSKEQINKVVHAHLAGREVLLRKRAAAQDEPLGGRRHVLGHPARRHREPGQREGHDDGRPRRRGLYPPPGQAMAVPQGRGPDDGGSLSLHLQGRVMT